jgi:Methyltransferase FkbM domain
MTLFAGNKVGSGGASLFERHDSYFADTTLRQSTVVVTTLDDIIQQNNISTIDFMKMDIEGAELLALKGATKALEQNLIKALSFEFGCGNVNSRTFFRDFWELLHPLGFVFYRILPGGGLWRVADYYEDLEYFRGDTNYIASRIDPV